MLADKLVIQFQIPRPRESKYKSQNPATHNANFEDIAAEWWLRTLPSLNLSSASYLTVWLNFSRLQTGGNDSTAHMGLSRGLEGPVLKQASRSQ